MSSFKEQSKIDWRNEQSKQGKYPGDMEIVIGCMQRIAEASELTAKNFLRLQSDLEWYKGLYERTSKENQRLQRSNAALRGHIKRLKK